MPTTIISKPYLDTRRKSNKRPELLNALVIIVESFYLFQIALCMFFITHTIVTQGEHILAVDVVLRIK